MRSKNASFSAGEQSRRSGCADDSTISRARRMIIFRRLDAVSPVLPRSAERRRSRSRRGRSSRANIPVRIAGSAAATAATSRKKSSARSRIADIRFRRRFIRHSAHNRRGDNVLSLVVYNRRLGVRRGSHAPVFPAPKQSMQINLTPDYSLLAIMVIFILNYLIVRKFFLRPINRVIEAREDEVRSANELYEQSMARFSEATAHDGEAAPRRAARRRRRARSLPPRGRARIAPRSSKRRTTTPTRSSAKRTTKLKEDVVEARAKIVSESEALAHLAAERILGRAGLMRAAAPDPHVAARSGGSLRAEDTATTPTTSRKAPRRSRTKRRIRTKRTAAS